jgi:hypothetical protein
MINWAKSQVSQEKEVIASFTGRHGLRKMHGRFDDDGAVHKISMEEVSSQSWTSFKEEMIYAPHAGKMLETLTQATIYAIATLSWSKPPRHCPILVSSSAEYLRAVGIL